MIKNGKIPYLFITGSSYSGSTLLAFLLNNHPQMVSIAEANGPDETIVLEKLLCSCGKLIIQCPFYLELERRINDLGSSFSLTNWQTHYKLSQNRLLDIILSRPLRNVSLERIRDKIVPLWPGYRKTVDLISRRKIHLAQAILDISGKQVFVDASKGSEQIKFLQEINQLDLYVIHLVRDVRGGTASYMKNSKINDVAKATRAWYNANMNSERSKRFFSSIRWLRLTYDELSMDTQTAMNRISDFMGLKRSVIPKDFYQSEHHIVGNRMRLKGIGTVRRDDLWKERITEHDLKIIARIGGKANRYFGHDWP